MKVLLLILIGLFVSCESRNKPISELQKVRADGHSLIILFFGYRQYHEDAVPSSLREFLFDGFNVVDLTDWEYFRPSKNDLRNPKYVVLARKLKDGRQLRILLDGSDNYDIIHRIGE